MELSIVIPTHDFDCSALVAELSRQCASCARLDTYEIIVVDDHSTTLHPELLTPHTQLLNSPSRGRAAARNTGIARATGDWLLLVDADAQVPSDRFVRNYVEAITPEAQVLVGGIVTLAEHATPCNQLRYRYETGAQKRHTLVYRRAHPYHNFSVFNAMLRRSLFETLQFEVSLLRYGHEDTLLGMRLQQHDIPVCHIDNPLIHTGIDNNRSFLHKTEQGLENLHHLSNELRSVSALIQLTDRLRKYHLAGLTRAVHRVFSPLIRRQLLGRRPSLLLFKCYKVGYYLSIDCKKEARLMV